MPEWFVCRSMQYYPDAEIITAATAEEAASIPYFAGMEGGIMVFPLEALAFVKDHYPDESLVERLRKDGAEDQA